MAIKPSGPIGLGTDLPAEFGGTAPFSLSQYYRGGGRVPDIPQNATVPTSGAINLGEFYNTINAFTLSVNTTVSNYNLYNKFVEAYGVPSSAVPVIFNIGAAGIIGGSGQTALTIGQFPAGSLITIYNNGKIYGFGGTANSGTGGDAINAAFPNQTMTFYNQTGAQCYAGGGGGGHGGTGGAGGGGYYDQITNKGAGRCYYQCGQTPGGEGTCDAYPGAFCNSGCTVCSPVASTSKCDMCATSTRNYTSGGSGGPGGDGGLGQGFNQGRTNGAAGGAGGSGGTNAGNGGTGGTGGDWGLSGGTGDTGATGANGNNGGGQAGTNGSGGGGAGRYYVKGSADFTFTNNGGSIAGGTA